MKQNRDINPEKRKLLTVITFIIFGIMFLMFWTFLISFIDFVTIRNILFCVVWVLEAICIRKLMKLVTEKNLSLLMVNIISGLMFAGIMSYLFWMIFTGTSGLMQFMGNNIYASGYSKVYIGTGSDSMETCIREALNKETGMQEKEYQEIYRLEQENVTWVFYGGTDTVLKFECVLEDNDQYYLSGSSRLVYHGVFAAPAYSDIETVRSDVANCIRNERWRISDGPVWGVTASPKGEEICINGIKADFTLEIKDKEGNSYYFWVIENIGDIEDAGDIKKMSIEGL